jgi:DUF438 domain-containing protein
MLVDSGTLAIHHRRCEEFFAAAERTALDKRWHELAARVNELREAVLAHFKYEEKHIFPLYEQTSGLEGSTEWLCAQHDDMRAAFWILGTISPQADAERYCAELAKLRADFDAHAADEESRMYPVFEQMLKK